MFFQGDLQSGIGLAIRESKSVACFVADDQEESSKWETKWLSDERVRDLLAQSAVLLRLQAGSQEASFLSAFCPVDVVPVLVIIHNGQLKETLKSGCDEDEFVSRVNAAFDVPAAIPPTRQTSTSAQQVAASSNRITPGTAQPPPTQVPAASDESPVSQNPASNRKGKQPLSTPPAPSSSSAKADKPGRESYLEQQRQQRIEAKQDRERVLARIEADKAERKAKEQLRKQELLAAQNDASTQSASSPLSAGGKRPSQAQAKHTVANVSVRLFDGLTVRKSFPPTATLDSDVRPWLSSHDTTLASRPYTFKQLLAPQPARNISIGEETQTFQDLDFLPSANLVLQPVAQGKFVDAYTGGSAGGSLWSLVSLPYNVASGALGMVSSALGYGESAPAGPISTTTDSSQSVGEASSTTSAPPTASGIRVRTLADQRRDEARSTQLYNGNQLNFESRDATDDENDHK